MKTKNYSFALFILIFLFGTLMTTYAQIQDFNRSTDLLLLCFDLKPDEDDVMAATATACILKHTDYDDVNYYAVAGAYGEQGCDFISAAVPGFYNTLFGAENTNWTNAHSNWSGSVTRVRDIVKSILDGGGKVYVAEAGQSDFNYDVCQALMNDLGVPLSTIQQKIVSVQHSTWNEDMTNAAKLAWIQANTEYHKIDDGNYPNNGTPDYQQDEATYLTQAKSVNNSNTFARDVWTEADNICDNWQACWENPHIGAGGVDFSDCAEIWYILNIDSQHSVWTVQDFWNVFVLGPIEPTIIPSIVQAENWSSANGVQTETTADEGGGANVGWIDAGDWMEYFVEVTTAETFSMKYRVASETTGGSLSLSLDGNNLGTTTFASTGGWQNWNTVFASETFYLTPGEYTFRITANQGGWNLNWIEFNVSLPTFTEETTKSEIKLFPNPTNNILHIQGANINSSAILYDMQGNVLHETIEDFIDMSQYANGVYFVKVDGKAHVVLKN